MTVYWLVCNWLLSASDCIQSLSFTCFFVRLLLAHCFLYCLILYFIVSFCIARYKAFARIYRAILVIFWKDVKTFTGRRRQVMGHNSDVKIKWNHYGRKVKITITQDELAAKDVFEVNLYKHYIGTAWYRKDSCDTLTVRQCWRCWLKLNSRFFFPIGKIVSRYTWIYKSYRKITNLGFQRRDNRFLFCWKFNNRSFVRTFRLTLLTFSYLYLSQRCRAGGSRLDNRWCP